MPQSAPPSPSVASMLAGLDAAPTPYHAVAEIGLRLGAGGFREQSLAQALRGDPGGVFVRRGGALVAWIQPDRPIGGYTIVGAHSDSPNLRVKRNADIVSAGWSQLGIEIYGGVLLNSWLDRDLGLAGRVTVRTGAGIETKLVRDDRPVLRVPQLAIHLDRDIRESGLLLNPQQHMNPLWALAPAGALDAALDDGALESGAGPYDRYLADLADVTPDQLLSSEIMAFDTQPAAVVGRDGDLIASARIDNQFSCFAAVDALIDVARSGRNPVRVPVFVMYDHEEIGSTSTNGAAGQFVGSLLERIAATLGTDRNGFLEQLARSIVISADGAHATHPNYADKHEPRHPIAVNAGVVVKRNANQRYATDGDSEWFIREVCERAALPLQTYHHRNDLPCGSTIGPLTAAALGVPTVDIGAPQLAMHSIRELAGTADVDHLIATLSAAWLSDLPLQQ